MGCIGGLNAGARHRGLGGPTREQMEKAKEVILALILVNPVMGLQLRVRH